MPEPEPEVVHEPEPELVHEPEPEVVHEPEPEPEPAYEPPPPPPRRTEPRPAPPRRKPAAPRKAPPLPRESRRRREPDALPPAARGPSRTGRRLLAAIAVLVVAVLVFVVVKTFQPFHDPSSGLVEVKVPEGASVGQIGTQLEQRGVIASKRWFELNATITNSRGGLRPGTYTLTRDMRYGTVLNALTAGPKAKVVKTFKLTVAEGLSAKELAPRIKGDVPGDYVEAATAPAALRRARRLGLPRRARTTEGFLFPATYDLVEGSEAKDLVAKQLDGFAANQRRVSYRRLIIASMIEREVQLDRERRLVASVIYNRLEQGIPLGIDATIRYAEDNWSEPLKVSELERPGPYNTRLNRGLPPTPIGNPGLASLRAAANPAKSDFLFYVVKPGGNGAHAFSETDAEFQEDVRRYNEAREANGGQSPG